MTRWAIFRYASPRCRTHGDLPSNDYERSLFMFQNVAHLLVRWSNQQYLSQRGTPASLRHQGEIPSRPVVFRRLWMFWIVLLAGTLAIASSVVPSSPSLPLVTGNGGP